ncbi:MAG TPA: M4 family metallopeptidase [Nitrososphaeraceae archaeon]|nr:M4 family metallopeptidase [Nitrososphaeraceae archaeon]
MEYSNLTARKYQQNYHSIRKLSHVECHFTPPYILRKQLEEGSQEQKRKALRNLELSSALRSQRRLRSAMYGMFVSLGPQKQRFIHDTENRTFPRPGKLIRSEGQPELPGDNDANKAYDGSGQTYDFYKEEFQRNSIDDNGMPLISSVRYDVDLDNAMWDGQYMSYGEGGGGFFKRGRMTDLVVCAHELTHGVTENESFLEYFDEMGGLNEGLSDIFGIMCEQWVKKQKVDDSSWLIGEGAVENGQGLRSMKEPGTAFPGDAQIGHYRDFDPGMDPHVCSGIPNKAFYLTCMEIGGYSWEKAGKIWYVALKDHVGQYTKFQDMANFTFTLAGQLFGDDIKKAVQKGWDVVGIKAKSVTVENFVKSRAATTRTR